MCCVGYRLVAPCDPVLPRHLASPEFAELWQDVPDPMRTLLPRSQLGQCPCVVALLRLDEALK